MAFENNRIIQDTLNAEAVPQPPVLSRFSAPPHPTPAPLKKEGKENQQQAAAALSLVGHRIYSVIYSSANCSHGPCLWALVQKQRNERADWLGRANSQPLPCSLLLSPPLDTGPGDWLMTQWFVRPARLHGAPSHQPSSSSSSSPQKDETRAGVSRSQQAVSQGRKGFWRLGSGPLGGGVKCLLGTHIKMLGMAALTPGPSPGEVGTGGSLELLGQPVYLKQ